MCEKHYAEQLRLFRARAAPLFLADSDDHGFFRRQFAGAESAETNRPDD